MSELFDCYNIINKNNNIANKCDNVEYSIHGMFNSSLLLLSTNKTKNNEISYANNFPTCIQKNTLITDVSFITKKNEHKCASFVADISPLSMQYIQIILTGEWLEVGVFILTILIYY